ncbi:MAG: universal stress protein [Burkholderiales bacterium]|nr:universal stress protein [Burkholderiales bacterium]
MYRRILVPVEGGAASEAGQTQAIGLAKTEGARLLFLNVLDETLGLGSEGVGYAQMNDVLRIMRERGEKFVENGISFAGKKGVRAQGCVLPTRGRRVSDVILDEARRWHADLIVMGTHGRRGFNRLLLGSDAERVLHDTPVPLLLVREGYAKPGRKRTARRKRATTS